MLKFTHFISKFSKYFPRKVKKKYIHNVSNPKLQQIFIKIHATLDYS